MKKVISLLLVLSMLSCGKKEGPTSYTLPVQTVHDVAMGFQGFYTLPSGGYTELVYDTGGLHDVNQLRLVVTNADSSTGLVPLGAVSNLPTINGSLVYTSNVTYAAGNSVKADVGNGVLTGSLFTMVTMFKVGSKLNIRVQISSTTGLLFDHVIVSL